MYLSWSDIYSSFLFHCWELLTHVHLMELFSMGLRYQFISTPPVILLITKGTQLFLLVEMFEVDRRNGRGHLYFGVDNSGCKQAGWSHHELNWPLSFRQWQSYLYLAKNENVRSGVLRLPQAQCKRTFTIGPNTCQLATVTVGHPARVNVQETNNSLCPWSCWSFSH